jgi:hypothetical protein
VTAPSGESHNQFWHYPKLTAADWSHNEAFVMGLCEYANERLN